VALQNVPISLRLHVVAVEVARDFSVGLGLRNLGMADEVPRPGGDETEASMPSR